MISSLKPSSIVAGTLNRTIQSSSASHTMVSGALNSNDTPSAATDLATSGTSSLPGDSTGSDLLDNVSLSQSGFTVEMFQTQIKLNAEMMRRVQTLEAERNQIEVQRAAFEKERQEIAALRAAWEKERTNAERAHDQAKKEREFYKMKFNENSERLKKIMAKGKPEEKTNEVTPKDDSFA